MLKLQELQQYFVNGLDSNDDTIFNYVDSNSRLNAKEHLDIYQGSIWGALQKVLKDIYPVCHKLVGDDFLVAMSNAYIKQTPSLMPDIGSYGENFSDFIKTFPPAKSLPYLSDVASLEWAWHKAFSGDDFKGIDFEKLAQCYTEVYDKIVFLLPSNSGLLFSIYPVHRIWEVNQDSYTGEQTIKLMDNEKYYYFIWRKGLEMRIDLVDEAEWTMLNLIQARHNLSEIYEAINELVPKVDFATLLPMIFARGWIAEYR